MPQVANNQSANNFLTYVLMTAARNEEAHIGETIRTVVAQTILPVRWVIVSDGSTDATDTIVAGLADTLSSSGYHCCVSTRVGTVNTAGDIYGLRRIPINDGDDLDLFAAKLSGAYDWIATFQAAFKKLRGAAGDRRC